MTRTACTSVRLRLSQLAIAGVVIGAFVVIASAQEHQHHEHNITPEMYAELREKIPLYQEYTDEQIIESMNRMGPNFDVYLSTADIQGDVGVIALGHGFGDAGNADFQGALGQSAETRPTAVGLGTAMMASAHVQSAVNNLTEAGAKTVVVIPGTTLDNGSLVRQWNYMFGLREEADFLSVPRIESSAKVIMAATPTAHPLMATIMGDYAKELSTDQANEVVAIITHGPVDEPDNIKEHEILDRHVQRIKDTSDFAAVKAFTLQDDAPSAICAANVENIRAWIEDATNDGKRVIVVTNLLVQGSVHGKIIKDLDGLSYDFNQKGVMLHPGFADWIEDTVSQALAKS